MMIGNKIDLAASAVVTTAEGKELAMKHKIAFIETSAKENKGVTAAFQHLLQAIYNLDVHNSQQQQQSPQQAAEKQGQGFILRSNKLRNRSNGNHNTTATPDIPGTKQIVSTRCCNMGG
jgi:tRNA U34 5-carboxymethylaminomethyl modifying GTPase MnmE/TrmE